MKASDYIAQFLYEQGVTHVFELVGGMITHMLDSLHQHGRVSIVSMHHEQSAAFAADAYGRVSGRPAVAMGTSGPGATNLLTGIGSCYFDSSPAVFITGQVNRHELKGDRPIRQLGFQETDIVSMAGPITKASWQVQRPEDLSGDLQRAFALATQGRPGPVLLDIPLDIQRADIEPPSVMPRILASPAPDALTLDSLFNALRRAERPLILAGGGVRAAQARSQLRGFAEAAQVPVINTLLAVDVLPFQHPLRVGMLGSYGNRWANMAIGRSDLLLVIGSRLDIRQTGAQTDAFKAGRTIFHVDVDPGEINNRIVGCQPIVADVAVFLQQALLAVAEQSLPTFGAWHDEIATLRRSWPDTAEANIVSGINPNEFMHRLSAVSDMAAAWVVDVGQHQMWAAQSLELAEGQHFLTSGGMGAMGFALPAAIGAALKLRQPVVVIAGDGGLQVNIQEFQTVVRNKLPIKIVVINNGTHGMVRQFQQNYFESRYQSTVWGYDAPDFVRVADAYGITGKTITTPEEMEKGVEWLWQDVTAPALLQVMVETEANAYPKIAFGRPIDHMEPQFESIGMEST